MKLYAVTEGAYSDYHIVTLQADREKAERIAEVLSDRGYVYDVEEFESDDWETDPRPVWSVKVDNMMAQAGHISKTESTVEWMKEWPSGLRVYYVKAKTPFAAITIVTDRLAKEKAERILEGLGVTDDIQFKEEKLT